MSIIVKGRTVIGPDTLIVTNGLIIHVDSANTRSYPGTGLVTNDMARLGETWNHSANLAVTPVPNGAYIYPDDNAARYMQTTGSWALTSATNTLTYDFWCNLTVPRNVSASTLFNDRGQSSGGLYAWVFANNSNLDIQYHQTAGNWGSTSFTNYFVGYSNQWVHVTVIVDYVTPAIIAYRNGQYVNTLTPPAITFPSGNAQKYIGTYQANGVYNWVGKLEVGKVYNRGLSAAEILQNYNALASRFINKNS